MGVGESLVDKYTIIQFPFMDMYITGYILVFLIGEYHLQLYINIFTHWIKLDHTANDISIIKWNIHHKDITLF